MNDEERLELFKKIQTLYSEEIAQQLHLPVEQRVASDFILDIYVYLRLLSPQTANSLIKIQQWPTIEQLDQHEKLWLKEIAGDEKIINGEVPSQDFLSRVIGDCIKEYCQDVKDYSLVFTCSQDALHFVPRVERRPIGSIGYLGTANCRGFVPIRAGFTFILNMLNKNIKGKLIFLFLQSQGNYNNQVSQILQLVKNAIQQQRQCYFCSTGDADQKFISEKVTPIAFRIIRNYRERRRNKQSLHELFRHSNGCPDRGHLLKAIKQSALNMNLVFDLSDRDVKAEDVVSIQALKSVLDFNKTHLNPSQTQKMRDDLAVQIINPENAYTLLKDDYIHQGIYMLLCTPLLVGCGETKQYEFDGLIRMCGFCMHVYQGLYHAYQQYNKRAPNVNFIKRKGNRFAACFSMAMLEKLIVYDAHLLRAVKEHDYTNILALGTFNNEVYHGKIRRCSNYDNSAIKAEQVVTKFMIIDGIDQATAIKGEERQRMSEYVTDIDHKIEIPLEIQNEDYQLAQQVVEYLCPRHHDTSPITREQFVKESLINLIKKNQCENFVPLKLYRKSKSTIMRLSKQSADVQDRVLRMMKKGRK